MIANGNSLRPVKQKMQRTYEQTNKQKNMGQKGKLLVHRMGLKHEVNLKHRVIGSCHSVNGLTYW